MKHPLVSVIIPTFNRAHCIKRTVESVLSQTFADYELIVVDDGSTDDTPKVLAAYSDRLRVIQQPNQGVSTARNTGIQSARGDWVAFLDSDDYWAPEKLSVQVSGVKLNNDVIAHMVDALIIGYDNCSLSLFTLRGMFDEYAQRPYRPRPLSDVLTTQFFVPSWMIKRNTLEKAGLFDVKLSIYEDFDLLTRVALEGPFMVDCYHGVYVCRVQGGAQPLSDQHRHARERALRGICDTYRRLSQDSRLSQSERRMVLHRLSGAHCELATEEWRAGQLRHSIVTLIQSMLDDPVPRSIARALVAGLGGQKLLKSASALLHRNRRCFRRSDLDANQSHPDKK
jgi:glycosyltransferase involved in cell wall biosynthesis